MQYSENSSKSSCHPLLQANLVFNQYLLTFEVVSSMKDSKIVIILLTLQKSRLYIMITSKNRRKKIDQCLRLFLAGIIILACNTTRESFVMTGDINYTVHSSHHWQVNVRFLSKVRWVILRKSTVGVE